MLVYEIIVDPNAKLLEQFFSDEINICYALYETYQKKSNDFSKPVDDLYEWNDIHENIYYVTHLIEILQEHDIPETSQVIIALYELLDYFNK